MLCGRRKEIEKWKKRKKAFISVAFSSPGFFVIARARHKKRKGGRFETPSFFLTLLCFFVSAGWMGGEGSV